MVFCAIQESLKIGINLPLSTIYKYRKFLTVFHFKKNLFEKFYLKNVNCALNCGVVQLLFNNHECILKICTQNTKENLILLNGAISEVVLHNIL